MPLIAEPLFWALAVPSVLLTGIGKGGFASGAGNVAVPLMALTVPAPQAAGIMLPVLCAMDVVGLRAQSRSRSDGIICTREDALKTIS